MLNHKGTITLTTPRLTLRRFEVADAQAMFDNWANDPRVTRHLTWQPHGQVENTRALLEGWCAGYERADYYSWAIVCGGRPVGGLAGMRLNERHESVELGYCLGYDWWNKGLMSEAVCAVRDFFFAQVGVHRIEILHAPQNPASGRVAQKCGFVREGVLRESQKLPDGAFTDLVVYAMLRREWEALKKSAR